jgi:hypothetical protein
MSVRHVVTHTIASGIPHCRLNVYQSTSFPTAVRVGKISKDTLAVVSHTVT